MEKPIRELAKEQNKAVIGKLNVDENSKTSRKYRIMSIPTLLYFKNGERIDKSVGATPKHRIKETTQRHL